MHISSGSSFPTQISSGILLTKEDQDDLIIKENCEKVLEYIKAHKIAYFSQIMQEFSLDLVQVKLILNTLEKEGKITTNE